VVLRAVFAAPRYRWRAAHDPLARLREALQQILDWMWGLHLVHPAAYWLLLAVLLTVSIALLVHIGYLLRQAVASRRTERATAGAEAVPPRDARWHLETARRLGAEGRFPDAIAHRWLALVLDLARRHAVTFHPSKTPMEIASEARLSAEALAELRALTTTLYAHLFGGAPCDAAAWLAFERGASDLSSHAAPA